MTTALDLKIKQQVFPKSCITSQNVLALTLLMPLKLMYLWYGSIPHHLRLNMHFSGKPLNLLEHLKTNNCQTPSFILVIIKTV